MNIVISNTMKIPLPASSEMTNRDFRASLRVSGHKVGPMSLLQAFLSPRICPACFSEDTRRSVRHGAAEFLGHWLLLTSPYRCRECHERYFGFRFALTRRKLPDGNSPSH